MKEVCTWELTEFLVVDKLCQANATNLQPHVLLNFLKIRQKYANNTLEHQDTTEANLQFHHLGLIIIINVIVSQKIP